MVNVDQISHLLHENFRITGTSTIDPQTGRVSVKGHVGLKTRVPQLLVHFDQVSGGFFCDDNLLTTLLGAPTHVGGDFWCQNTPLTSLEHAPDSVGGWFVCSHDPQLPMLRLINYQSVKVRGASDSFEEIVDAYAGKGKAHMLNFALDLKKAGYGGNAKW